MDIERLNKAIIYVSRMANGHNPINNSLVDDSEIFNNPNFIRCMYFIKDVLESVQKNGGVIGRKSNKFPFPLEVLENFQYQEDTTISKFFKQINELIDESKYEKLKFKPVLDYLKENEFIITKEMQGYDRKVTVVTDKGMDLGLYNEVRTLLDGRRYLAVIYSKRAQMFIINNIEELILN